MKLPFIIEKTYDAPMERVWQALTDKDLMKQWYFDLKEFKPEVGFEFQFDGGSDDKVYHHLCKVTEVIAGKKIAYSWKYKDYEGSSVVSFELFAEGNKTRLKLTHEGLETFPQNNPDFAVKSFEGGWTYFTGTALKDFLAKETIDK
ncbi:MAG: SRPBCC domain-containing protein [Bacteroidota bacterium]